VCLSTSIAKENSQMKGEDLPKTKADVIFCPRKQCFILSGGFVAKTVLHKKMFHIRKKKKGQMAFEKLPFFSFILTSYL